jgi:ribosome biogenesis GTPase
VKGIVQRSTGKYYKIKTDEGVFIDAQIKGKIRLLNLEVTNPIAVGDIVSIEKTDKEWMITAINERKNYIIRVSPKKKSFNQIIASNIDQVILVVTLDKPRTSSGFIDRFLLTAEAYHIPTVIVFNKQDALNTKDEQKQQEWVDRYQTIGYKTILCSAFTKQGVDVLKNTLTNKTSLLSGHSGVGKSSLVNAVDSSLALKTKEISKKFSKGVHTTTYAEMFELPFGGNIIDVPGIKEFGISFLTKYEISGYFKEFKTIAAGCKFSNCLHLNEPNCKIKDAVNEGIISDDRYLNYLNIVDSLDNHS